MNVRLANQCRHNCSVMDCPGNKKSRFKVGDEFELKKIKANPRTIVPINLGYERWCYLRNHKYDEYSIYGDKVDAYVFENDNGQRTVYFGLFEPARSWVRI